MGLQIIGSLNYCVLIVISGYITCLLRFFPDNGVPYGVINHNQWLSYMSFQMFLSVLFVSCPGNVCLDVYVEGLDCRF